MTTYPHTKIPPSSPKSLPSGLRCLQFLSQKEAFLLLVATDFENKSLHDLIKEKRLKGSPKGCHILLSNDMVQPKILIKYLHFLSVVQPIHSGVQFPKWVGRKSHEMCLWIVSPYNQTTVRKLTTCFFFPFCQMAVPTSRIRESFFSLFAKECETWQPLKPGEQLLPSFKLENWRGICHRGSTWSKSLTSRKINKNKKNIDAVQRDQGFSFCVQYFKLL